MIALLNTIQEALPEGYRCVLSIRHNEITLSIRHKDVRWDKIFSARELEVLENEDMLHEVILKMIKELKEVIDETGI